MVLLRFTVVVLLVLALFTSSVASIIGSPSAIGFCGDPAAANITATRILDPNDCSMYYLCHPMFNGKFACNSGEHFSQTLQRCTDPCEAGCDPTVCGEEEPCSNHAGCRNN